MTMIQKILALREPLEWQPQGFGELVTNLYRLDSFTLKPKIGDTLGNVKDLAILGQNS